MVTEKRVLIIEERNPKLEEYFESREERQLGEV